MNTLFKTAFFEAYLGAATTGRVGAQHVLNAEYFKRIDALNYTMIHDDGQHGDGTIQRPVLQSVMFVGQAASSVCGNPVVQ